MLFFFLKKIMETAGARVEVAILLTKKLGTWRHLGTLPVPVIIMV
jgi:hypothetical protein